MPPRLVVRPLRDDDSLAQLTLLLHRAYAGLAKDGMRYWASHQSEADTQGRIERGECFVAAIEERLVGTILLWPPSLGCGCDWYARDDVSSIHQFGVDPTWQGQKIGTGLLLATEKRAQELGARELALDTAETAARLIAMYEQRGYRFVQYANWDKTSYRSVVLSKRIG